MDIPLVLATGQIKCLAWGYDAAIFVKKTWIATFLPNCICVTSSVSMIFAVFLPKKH
jgi:hypothetical protein